MKCDFKYCKHKDNEEITKVGRKKYHEACAKDMDYLKQAGNLWIKYYNNTESWNIMMRSLYNWYKIHDAEYICFCMSKAIKAKEKINSFYGFYYILNNRNYKDMYDNYKNPQKNVVFDRVYMKEHEYNSLIAYMGDNLKKLEYYIKKLNDYIYKTGKEYSSHYETLKIWYDKEELSKPVKPKSRII